jgi:hypothetical protein
MQLAQYFFYFNDMPQLSEPYSLAKTDAILLLLIQKRQQYRIMNQ